MSAYPSHCFWIDASQECSPTDVDSNLQVPSMCTFFFLASWTMCWWQSVHFFHESQWAFDPCDSVYLVHVIQQCSDMTHQQQRYSSPQVWCCLCHLFHSSGVYVTQIKRTVCGSVKYTLLFAWWIWVKPWKTCQDSESSSRDLNWRLCKYMAEVWLARLWHLFGKWQFGNVEFGLAPHGPVQCVLVWRFVCEDDVTYINAKYMQEKPYIALE